MKEIGYRKDTATPPEEGILIFCQKIARLISEGTDPSRILRVINLSNQGKHIFHGIKRHSALEAIRRQGILPLSPEGGPGSFWTSGSRIFGSSLSTESGFLTYDTVFFHYGHALDQSYKTKAMLIAITNARELNRLGLDGDRIVERNGYITVNIPLPRNSITLLRVERMNSSEGGPNGLQKAMLELMENALVAGYRLGEEISVEL